MKMRYLLPKDSFTVLLQITKANIVNHNQSNATLLLWCVVQHNNTCSFTLV